MIEEFRTSSRRSTRLYDAIDPADRNMFLEGTGSAVSLSPLRPASPYPPVPVIRVNPSTPVKKPNIARSRETMERASSPVHSTSTGGVTNAPSGAVDSEGVYEKYLLASSTVVRVGRGYQSDQSRRRSSFTDDNPTGNRRRSFFGRTKDREHIIQ